jgi:GNAT superfamily N-acetyltransferase
VNRFTKLTRAQKRAAVDTLARAFVDERIMTYYFPEAGPRRTAGVVSLMTLAVNHGQLYGEIYATGPGGQSPFQAGVAIWYPPTYSGPSTWKDIRSGGLSLLLQTGFAVVRRMNDHVAYSIEVLQEQMRRIGQSNRPYWELWLLAVAPERQGQGYASQLLRPMLASIDAEAMPCYLDTQSEANLSLYERFGFRVVATGQLPGTEIPHWLMCREPGANVS